MGQTHKTPLHQERRFGARKGNYSFGGVSGQATTPINERTPAERAASAAATVRPRERGRQGRRGRRH